MIIEAVVFLVIIGVIVLLTITDKNDKKENNDSFIDFRKSHDISGDINKLRSKLDDNVNLYKTMRRTFITIFIIIAVILIGFIVVATDLINKASDIINDNDKVKEDIYLDVYEKEDIDENNNDEDENKEELDIKLNKLTKELKDMIKIANNAGDTDKATLISNIKYRVENKDIENKTLEIYLISGNEYLLLDENYLDNYDKVVDKYFNSELFNKYVLIDGDGVLKAYIFETKK
ncbi:MAG: hypothetical protein MJ245_02715 [Clostridia bacterium]|nr:hypothetical protein [Clostridia bacterium]